ncbi:hypothetical protein C8Q78DRAFT_1026286 [Trametes maxima]|nr:hypothetical protein C8Q78DRAFT_1026286 [Trametes maxima]
MASASDDTCAVCCGACCITCTEALEAWCMLTPCGNRSSTKQAGCCTRCCGESFDEDDFAPKEGRGGNEVNAAQPAPLNPMSDKPPGPPTSTSTS